MNLEFEFVRWMLLMIAAVALVLALAAALGAADPMTPPMLLPDVMGVLAKPMTPQLERPFFPEKLAPRMLAPGTLDEPVG